MRILILGGDGYLGWPTSMALASDGHQIIAVDNYLRREIAHTVRDPSDIDDELRLLFAAWGAPRE